MSVSAWAGDGVMTRESDGTYVINTTTLCEARGYMDITPVEVHIKDNKVVKVVPLKNQESPGYFRRVIKALFPQFVDMKLSDAEKGKVDAVSGATYSSVAVTKNVQAAVAYYKKHK